MPPLDDVYPSRDVATAVRLVEYVTTFAVLVTGPCNVVTLRCARRELEQRNERCTDAVEQLFFTAAITCISAELARIATEDC
jgi:hypothetical protein